MDDVSSSSTVQFLAYLPVVFVAAVIIVAVTLVVVHFLEMKR